MNVRSWWVVSAAVAAAACSAIACSGSAELLEEQTKPQPYDTTPTQGTGSEAIGGVGLTALAYFEETVHPSLSSTCGGCHADSGPGPAWLFSDAQKTYDTMENLGMLAKDSIVLGKGSHYSAAAPALTATQTTMVTKWIDKEYTGRGNAGVPSGIKAKLGPCFDKAKFDAIGLGALRTTKRTNENANNCTGCNNAPCMTCHTTDTATGVIIADGNNNVPKTYTFDKAKETPFIDLVIGTNGSEIVGSRKLALKSKATVGDKPYTHPMFTVTTLTQDAIDEFAKDVNAKRKAGMCQ